MFIEKSRRVHGDKYDYSKVNFINSKTKVIIICPLHGEFNQQPSNHLKGSSCPKCANNVRLSNSQFIEKSRKIHGNKYDYSKVDYINYKTNVIIICPFHGEFNQQPSNHLKGSSCPKCKNTNSKSNKHFIQKSQLQHGDKYDYSKVNYIKNNVNVIVICNEHGEFIVTPSNHYKGSSCPKCSESKGESSIRLLLEEYDISYIQEYKFKKFGNYRFDFYLPELNTCIEYDGIQHFEAISYFGELNALYETQSRDQIKNEYCKMNNIKLIRIKYNTSDIMKRKIISDNKSLI